jgi:hypothetical protein
MGKMAVERDKNKLHKYRVLIGFETDGSKLPKDSEMERIIFDALDIAESQLTNGLTVMVVEVRGEYK